MQPEREQHLVQHAATSPAAFSALYREYFPKIYGYVMYRVRDPYDAEDIVANVFTRMLEGIAQFEYRGDGSLAAWLFRIAANGVNTHYRQRTKQTVVFAEPLDTDELDGELLHQEQAALLHALVDSLSRQRREVVSLKFFAGLRNQEIAQVLGLDERTVASHLCRGIEDLRAKYRQRVAREDQAHE